VISIRPAEAADVLVIATFIDEIERFYGEATGEPIEELAHKIGSLIFRQVPVASVLLAFDEAEPVGLASYSFLWPASGVTHSLYLKELYVRDAYRSQGVGKLFMAALRDIAVAEGCSRIEWTTDRSNEGAQAFYKRLGFEVHDSKIFYRIATS
jgi:GNAT superfamily N-acetyltransferase